LLELPEQVKTPIRYLLKGRKVTDMEVFEADKVVDALLGEDKHSDVNTNVELTAKDKRVSNFCMLVLP
jgi:signal recognition particle GTPase